jgi:hypothetical protein
MPESVTQILSSGPVGQKKNLAILGDGFTEAEQGIYNDWVQKTVMEGVFGHDYFNEDLSAWNIFRVNLFSKDSGVSQRVWNEMGTPDDASDDVIISATVKDTALGMIWNGSWAHCWLEYGADTENRIQNALNQWVPDYNFVLIVLNEPSGNGCGGGGRAHVSSGVNWTTVAHEFGHGMGGLADEYCATWSAGAEPSEVNVTVNTNRATLKWGQFVSPATPIPTGAGSCVDYNQGLKPADWDDSQSVGLFEGAQYCNTGKYRPAINCRMNGNVPPYCPVCYTSFKQRYDHYTGHTFLNCYVGDFNGDGRSDVLIHYDNSIQIFHSNGSQLDLVYSTYDVPGWGEIRPHDKFYVGDFNGDGKDEVVVFNGDDWDMPYLGVLADDGSNGLVLTARYDGNLPGWGDLKPNDLFYPGDFDGDGKQDLYVFNGTDWSMVYVGLLQSDGYGFNCLNYYGGDIPGWGGLTPNDRLFVGDFNGDGKSDLLIFNGDDWSMVYIGIFKSNGGGGLQMVARYDGDVPGWGGLARSDIVYLGDFNGDGRTDLILFNGLDWSMAYLGLFRSTEGGLDMVARYDGEMPVWGTLTPHDVFFPADIDGDNKTDLFAYNCQDWAEEYLGKLISDGNGGFSGSYIGDWVGEWNLGSADLFKPCNFEGGQGVPDLFVHNLDWFGMISAQPDFTLWRLYYRWIHNYRYGRNW